ncbi:hypothetical protein AAHC03_04925 [Spirometra sp. Aus1]
MDANISDLQARLEVAERLLAEQLPNVAREAVEHANATLEAERLQLQEELDRRLADCGTTHALSIAELEATRANLVSRLATAEARATQLETELKASTQKLRSTERFLNEQLQEREQEREEFQTEIDFWRSQVAELKSKITYLEVQLSQKVSSSPSVTPPETPRIPPPSTGVEHGELGESAVSVSPPPPPATAASGLMRPDFTFAPEVKTEVASLAPGNRRKLRGPVATLQDSPETEPSMSSDVDESVPFEIVGSLRRPVAISPSLQSLKHSRPLSADLDSRFSVATTCCVRQSPAVTGRPTDKVSVCVGGCPVEVTDTAVSPRSTTSVSLSASFDSDAADSCSYEGEDVGQATETTVTTRTISAAVGLITTQTTTSSSKRPTRKKGLARYHNHGDENTIDLSMEMQHAAQLEELRTALSRAEAQLVERDAAAEQLRKQLDAALAVLPEPSTAAANTAPTAPSHLPNLPPSASPMEFSFQHSLDSVTPLPSLTDDTGVEVSGSTAEAVTEVSKFVHSQPILQTVPAIPSTRLFVSVAAQTVLEEMEREANSPTTEALEDDTLKPRSLSLGASDSGPAPEEAAETLPLAGGETEADGLTHHSFCLPVEEEEPLQQEKDRQQPIFSRESTMSPTHTATDSVSTAAASGVTSVDSCDVESDVAQVTCATALTSLVATTADQYPEVGDIHQLVADLEDARAEITSLRAEIEGLMVYQDDLHHDFELVQTMLEDRQSEVERLQQDLLVAQTRVQSDFDNPIRKLQRRVTEPCTTLEERDEDLYVLNEAKTELTNRVRELEEELDSLRRHSLHVDVSETASQTDPSTPTLSTSDSAIQVDLNTVTSYFPGFDEELPPSTRRTTVAGILTPDSDSDTDCVSEDYLPFDCPGGEAIVSNLQTTPILGAPQLTDSAQQVQQEDMSTPEAVKALVEHLHYESCRLLSLSLAMSARNTTADEKAVKPLVTSSTIVPSTGNAVETLVDTSTMGSDYKSQALTRLIEANRLLKNLLESLMTSKETQLATDRPFTLASSPLLTALLSILVADRKAHVSLLCNASIEQGSKLGLPPRPLSGPQQKNIPTLADFIRSLTAYVDAEEQRWNTLTSAVAADRQELESEIESARQREETLKSEVTRLSKELTARDAVLLEKAASVDKQLAASQRERNLLRTKLEETTMECQKLTATLEQTRILYEEERRKSMVLEKSLADKQSALESTEEKLKSANVSLQKEQIRGRLADGRISQLEQELDALRISISERSGKVFTPAPLDASAKPTSGESTLQTIVNRASSQIASARQTALQAEKMSRDLHACNQGLRLSLAEAELRLMPSIVAASVAGEGHNGQPERGAASRGTNGTKTPEAFFSTMVNQDAPDEIRRLQYSLQRLLHLVLDASADLPPKNTLDAVGLTSESTSEDDDSLNNPAELLRHGMQRSGSPVTCRPPRPAEIAACLRSINDQIRGILGSSVPLIDSGHTVCSPVNRRSEFEVFASGVSQARDVILSGVDRLNNELKYIQCSTGDLSRRTLLTCDPVVRSTDGVSKACQCALLSQPSPSTGSQTVSLERFRHMSARCLRMESYRRALVYQKRYLLLLLGDFQHSEQVVTASLGRGLLMGTSSRLVMAEDDATSHWPLDVHPSLVRFRAAARTVQFVYRIKLLLAKWQRTGIKSQATPFPVVSVSSGGGRPDSVSASQVSAAETPSRPSRPTSLSTVRSSVSSSSHVNSVGTPPTRDRPGYLPASSPLRRSVGLTVQSTHSTAFADSGFGFSTSSTPVRSQDAWQATLDGRNPSPHCTTLSPVHRNSSEGMTVPAVWKEPSGAATKPRSSLRSPSQRAVMNRGGSTRLPGFKMSR